MFLQRWTSWKEVWEAVIRSYILFFTAAQPQNKRMQMLKKSASNPDLTSVKYMNLHCKCTLRHKVQQRLPVLKKQVTIPFFNVWISVPLLPFVSYSSKNVMYFGGEWAPVMSCVINVNSVSEKNEMHPIKHWNIITLYCLQSHLKVCKSLHSVIIKI